MYNKGGKFSAFPLYVKHVMTAYSPFTSVAIANNANAALTNQNRWLKRKESLQNNLKCPIRRELRL